MKRWISILLALLLAQTGFAALAEEPFVVRVQDGAEQALSGMAVTLRDQNDSVVQTATTDENGSCAFAGLADGVYTAQAVDPSDGYATLSHFALPDTPSLTMTLRKLEPGSHICVGTLTRPSGAFFTSMWGSNTTDIDVRTLLHGYDTVAWSNDSQAVLDTSVAALDQTMVAGNGDKTYTFTVKDGMCYSDGTPITARDYVFSVLLQSSPQVQQLGAQPLSYAYLEGQSEYLSGDSNRLTGVRLLGDMQFSLTVDSAYLPYYYELIYLSVTPYPIHVIAPGCEVADDGEGAYIRSAQGATGSFTSETLQRTLLDEQTGYLSHPTVTSGPYTLISYDDASGVAEFAVNPYYRGNYEGQRPMIEQITLRPVDKSNCLQSVQEGAVQVLNKVTDTSVQQAGMELQTEGLLKTVSYLRTGQAFLGFACEQGPTARQSVRQAVCYCLDRQALTTAYTGTYGLPVYSQYGLGQWMVTDYLNTMDQEVTTYPFDLTKAAKLLQKDGWTYNERGEKFDADTDRVRYRRLDRKETEAYAALTDPVVQSVVIGKYTYLPLELRFAKTTGNDLCSTVEQMLFPNLEKVGFRVVTQEVTFDEALRCYYRQTERTFNLFAMASNFSHVYDPYYEFSDDPAYQGTQNKTGVEDAKLLKLAREMRETAPDDTADFVKRWLKVMKRYSEVLPTVPIYSNVYADFVANGVEGYQPNNHWSWPSALLYTYLSQPSES